MNKNLRRESMFIEEDNIEEDKHDPDLYADEYLFCNGKNISYMIYDEDEKLQLRIFSLDKILSSKAYKTTIAINERNVVFNITAIPEQHACLKFNTGLKPEISLNLHDNSLIKIYPENNFLWQLELTHALDAILTDLDRKMQATKKSKSYKKLIRGLK